MVTDAKPDSLTPMALIFEKLLTPVNVTVFEPLTVSSIPNNPKLLTVVLCMIILWYAATELLSEPVTMAALNIILSTFISPTKDTLLPPTVNVLVPEEPLVSLLVMLFIEMLLPFVLIVSDE